jgi:murein L,D-transpeptidase YafK
MRALLATSAIAASLVLAGCTGDDLTPNGKASKPIPEKLLSEISEKNMDKESPLLVRIFKQEAELEVWKQDRSGSYALLKTYPICRWSGELGPKIREGDRQAPEGFYTITPAQMNPQSQYYLSFNMGYPNAFDKSLGRTGSQLMVHGDCSSRGCYAMTDEQISEIYALGRESFFGGQRAFQIQAYPFRMTPQNMAKHRNNPHMPFWKMIKQGYDHFEVTKQEPKIDVCEKQYVFNGQSADGKPVNFTPAGKCPVYQVPEEIAQAVLEKQRTDELQTAQLISRGSVAAAPVRTGSDGGMHPVFASKLGVNAGASSSGEYSLASYTSAPSVNIDRINPPKPAEQPFVAAPAPATPAPVVAPTRTASTESTGGFFDRMAKSIGLRSDDDKKPAAAPAAKTQTASIALPRARPVAAKAEQPKSEMKSDIKTVAARPAAAPAQPQAVTSSTAAPTITGSAPIVGASSFDSRWSGFR